jgi:hypothetical protein|tara:strand:- start:235 stop:381 length:147 start_codon:yes stop_codon:yes gene_type:complete
MGASFSIVISQIIVDCKKKKKEKVKVTKKDKEFIKEFDENTISKNPNK